MAKSERESRVARVVMTLLSCCLLMSMQSRAYNDETGRITILEENDSLYFNSAFGRMRSIDPTLIACLLIL